MGGAPEAYVSQFVCVRVRVCVCVCMCVTLQLRFLEARDKLSVDTCNIGTTRQYYLKAKGLQFSIYKALFSSYSMICLP